MLQGNVPAGVPRLGSGACGPAAPGTCAVRPSARLLYHPFSKHGFGGDVEELLLADMSLQTASSQASTGRMLSMLQTAGL